MILASDGRDGAAHAPSVKACTIGAARRNGEAEADRVGATVEVRELGHQLELLTEAERVRRDQPGPPGVRSTIWTISPPALPVISVGVR